MPDRTPVSTSGTSTVAWEVHSCSDFRSFDRTCLACQDRARMRGHYMHRVISERLDAAVRWIVADVIGGGRIKAGLPRELRGEIANYLVNDRQYGWPDSETALDYLDDEAQFVEASA